mgnify:CR=1 FL=1
MNKRLLEIKKEILRISKIPLKYLIEYIKNNYDKLYHNYEVGNRLYTQYIENDMTSQFIIESSNKNLTFN